MGDKYIIELEDKPFHKKDGDFLYRVKGFNSLVFDMTGISKLTPYTEPDLEQVRKEAYDEGYEDAEEKYNDGYSDGYDAGLDDAWKAARKFMSEVIDARFRNNFMVEIFRWDNAVGAMKVYSASEAIEKIRQYEQEQEAEIKIGDVVRMKNAPEVEIWVTATSDKDGGLLSGLALKTVDDYCDMGGIYVNRSIDNFERIGKHYDVPTVLEKMRGEQEQ